MTSLNFLVKPPMWRTFIRFNRYASLLSSPNFPLSENILIEHIGATSKILWIFSSDGQSNAAGSQGFPLTTYVNPYPTQAMMLGSDVRMGLGPTSKNPYPILDSTQIDTLNPIRAKRGATGTRGRQGETPAEQLAIRMAWAAEIANINWASAWFCVGLPGRPYEAVMKGTNAYNNRLSAITRIKELASEVGFDDVFYAGTLWRGGESATRDSIDTYKNKLMEHQINIEADISALTGQRHRPLFWMTQSSTFSSNRVSPYLAMLELHQESSQHVLLGPDYPYPYSIKDGRTLHIDGPGNARIGATHALRIVTLKKSDPVLINSAERSGTTVRIYYAPLLFPPIVVDTTLVPERDFRGFQYICGNIMIDITSISIINDGSDGQEPIIDLTLAEKPSSQEEWLLYAINGHSRTRRLETIPRGNIRDSAGDYQPRSVYDYQPLHNWAVHQKFRVK
ncbi:hypothetical protein [Ancylobacter oerskovii]|uniref:Sialate O-acetylesterase domain-containing protein n=1 Tax=Ancylobacter oerskovii TaxID=459519 RepID=A0ABW4Z5B6_9HYPH|nr:hypothetical protein [Ancylobacter oerskovii]MBS7544303.1 hypothetical protein [Ancylobacter oerskovii]